SGAATVSCGGQSANFSDTQKSVQICVNGTGTTCSGGSLATTTYQTDAFGRLVSVTEPDSNVTSYSYNVLDKLTSVTQGGQQARVFTSDSFGFLRQETTPEKGAVNFTQYDVLGNLRSSIEPNNVTLSRAYDAAGRLLTLSSSEPGSPTYIS